MADFYVVAGQQVNQLVLSQVTSPTGSGFSLGQWVNLTSILLPIGFNWRVYGSVGQAFVLLLTSWGASVSQNSGNVTTNDVAGINFSQGPLGITGGLAGGCDVGPVMFDLRQISSALTVYLKVRAVGATGDAFTGQLVAIG